MIYNICNQVRCITNAHPIHIHPVLFNIYAGLESMVPIYQYLINGGYNLNILVYSGDDDSVCGTVGTQSWIWDMGYTTGLNEQWEQYTFEVGDG